MRPEGELLLDIQINGDCLRGGGGERGFLGGGRGGETPDSLSG